MIKYTTNALRKIEALFQTLDYVIRYEKGSFQSGYCIVQNKKIIVINKFFDTEAKINCLVDILGNIEFNEETLDEKGVKFLHEIRPTRQQPKLNLT